MHHRRILAPSAAAALAVVWALGACSSSTPSNAGNEAGVPEDPFPTPEGGAVDRYVPPPADAGPDPLLGCTKDPGAPAVTVDPSSAMDPVAGGAAQFTLAKALDGFPAGGGKLTAGITTEHGGIKCTLDETAAPISVANFVGLARGTRPFKDAKGKWTTGHFYDGLIWHRVIPKFVIQGGDPDGLGTGGPGYDLVKENQIAEPLGTLAMAASTTVSGSQFYIVVGTGPKAEYNVFGSCDTDAAIAIAGVKTDADDAPVTAVHMIKVEIARCP
ncbi:MAG: Peptidyl-prolyl cis-trans isomerase [Labilithrix sp.]|nr:Peptidyl-prolyl cis-trans isomerase [Labilithrix sp.]